MISNYQPLFLKYLTARTLPAVLVQVSLNLKPWPLIGCRLNQHDTGGSLFDSVNRSRSRAPDETVSVSLRGTRRRKATSGVDETASPEPACKQHDRLFHMSESQQIDDDGERAISDASEMISDFHGNGTLTLFLRP